PPTSSLFPSTTLVRSHHWVPEFLLDHPAGKFRVPLTLRAVDVHIAHADLIAVTSAQRRFQPGSRFPRGGEGVATGADRLCPVYRSEEHTSELQSRENL